MLLKELADTSTGQHHTGNELRSAKDDGQPPKFEIASDTRRTLVGICRVCVIGWLKVHATCSIHCGKGSRSALAVRTGWRPRKTLHSGR
jgi:hypothetical protein